MVTPRRSTSPRVSTPAPDYTHPPQNHYEASLKRAIGCCEHLSLILSLQPSKNTDTFSISNIEGESKVQVQWVNLAEITHLGCDGLEVQKVKGHRPNHSHLVSAKGGHLHPLSSQKWSQQHTLASSHFCLFTPLDLKILSLYSSPLIPATLTMIISF